MNKRLNYIHEEKKKKKVKKKENKASQTRQSDTPVRKEKHTAADE